MRACAVVGLTLALVACGTRPSSAPLPGGLAIGAFCDDLHSGLLLPPGVLGGHDRGGWVEVGFTERAWTEVRDRSALHASRIALVGGEGAIYVEPLDPGEVPRGRRWRFDLDPAAAGALVAALRSWTLEGGQPWTAEATPGIVYLPAAHWWWLGNSCHDFTASCLRTAGLPLRHRLGYSAGKLTGDIDRGIRSSR